MNNYGNLFFASITVYLIGYFLLNIFPLNKDGDGSFELETEEESLLTHNSHPVTPTAESRVFHLPPPKDGVIVLTSTSTVALVEAGLQVAQQGYHVLFGIQSEADRRAFHYYHNRKGIELIQFNMFDPSTFPDLIYRLRLIQRDLHRPLSGLVVNLAEYLEEQVIDEASIDLLEAKSIEEVYKFTFASPMKTIIALFQLVKHQNEHKEENPGEIDSEEEMGEDASNEAWNAAGFRIVILSKHYNEDSCFLHCILQKSFVEYVQLLLRTNIAQNYSVSIIPIVAKTSQATSQAPPNQPVIPWELDLSEEEEIETSSKLKEKESDLVQTEKSFAEATRSIVHSLLSRNPLNIYPAGTSAISSTTKPSSTQPQKISSTHKMKTSKSSSNSKSFNPYERYARSSSGNRYQRSHQPK